MSLPALPRLAWIGALVAATSAFTPATADAARPKPSFGCSIAQLQSPAASQCIRKAEQDIMAGRPTTHVVYCSSTGKMLCCLSEGSNIVDQSCEIIQTISVPLDNVIVDGLTVMSSEPSPNMSIGTPSR
jgi:hypothetical protein